MLERLYETFDEIIDGKSDFVPNSKCIMNCGHVKGMVLLPCAHQPTCKPCYVLWKVHVVQKGLNVFCPVCRSDVTNQIPVADI